VVDNSVGVERLGRGAAASESQRRIGGRHLGSCEVVSFTGGDRSGL